MRVTTSRLMNSARLLKTLLPAVAEPVSKLIKGHRETGDGPSVVLTDPEERSARLGNSGPLSAHGASRIGPQTHGDGPTHTPRKWLLLATLFHHLVAQMTRLL